MKKAIPRRGGKRPGSGRKPTGTDPARTIRLSDEFIATVDAWAAERADQPGRSEAIRRLVEFGLKAHTPETKAVERLRERVAGAAELAAKAVDSLTVVAADADKKASRKRRLTKAKEK